MIIGKMEEKLIILKNYYGTIKNKENWKFKFIEDTMRNVIIAYTKKKDCKGGLLLKLKENKEDYVEFGEPTEEKIIYWYKKHLELLGKTIAKWANQIDDGSLKVEKKLRGKRRWEKRKNMKNFKN